MKHTYHYKENFFNASTKTIPIQNEKDEVVFEMALYYQSDFQKVSGYLGHLKHNFTITDNQTTLRSERESFLSSPLKQRWKLYEDDHYIGELRTKLSWRSKLVFKDVSGYQLELTSSLFKKAVKVTDDMQNVVMTTKSELFKIASRHDLFIEPSPYSDMLLILLFQIYYEFQEARQNAASSAST
ncbi:tubby C-terminal domain-like protein [Staphylococcus canis]|uniref:Tubby C-terminal domain-containing protein n=1 Tax=Staphylococcus canis TaxID=2724942 RepID=A0ABS0T6J1_9STAP|nr:hypothetical protein [Staphylococcus canis]MBI5974365.1 hypothetical protein [Staphylococcus canis]